ncbi:MAG TPA: VOC family protein [Ignavibacteriaceae bacterium]
MPVKPIPDGYPRVTPYLIVENVGKLMDFLTSVFDAVQVEKMTLPDGSINHGEVRIGDSMIMIGKSNKDYPPIPVMLYVYVENTDETYSKALGAGARSIMAPADQFYGDRNAAVADPSGNSWWIATHIEDVSPDEMKRRNEERAKQS